MMLTNALLVALVAQAPVQAVEQVDVAYEEMASGENVIAIKRLEANDELRTDDPSRLINLGVAYAREGNVEQARMLFRAAVYSPERQLLETSEGEWVDSRILARKALARLEEAESARYTQVALAQPE